MRLPKSLVGLVDDGIIEKVVRPLQSGKEAQVFLVNYKGNLCVAKVYKESTNRSFKHRAEYEEGRKVRNSRQQRAMNKRSKFGKAASEQAWNRTEIDMLHRLATAGVRVPQIFEYVDNVLIMELITNGNNEPAPRLADVSLNAQQAEVMFKQILREVIKMLCAGVVHGDLSDFNILIEGEGPVIIDLPQAIDTAHNRNARRLLIRDVKNLTYFLSRFIPHLRHTRYAQEMWGLYEDGKLEKDTELTGRYQEKNKRFNEKALLQEIQAAAKEEAMRRQHTGLSKYAARRAKKLEALTQNLERKAESVSPSPSPSQDRPDRKSKPRSSHRKRRNRFKKSK